MLKKTLLATAVIGALSLTACKDNGQQAQQPGLFPVKGEVVASVNGVDITQPQIDEYVDYRAGMNQPAADPVEELINLEILRQAAVEQGFADKPEVRAAMTRAATNTLANPLVREKISGDVSDEDLRAEYDEQVKMMEEASGGGSEFNASHILVESEEEAKALIKQLDDGADFATLAEENSVGPSASSGGSLGWATADTYVEAFATALEQLEDGSYTAVPVETQFGWHVILRSESRESQAPEAPAFDMVKSQLEKVVMQKRMQSYMENLRNKANVVIAGQDSDSEASSEEAEHAEEAAPSDAE